MSSHRGIFVSFDGPNGVGKTSLIEGVVMNLRNGGYKVHRTKELTDTSLGRFIRANHGEYRGDTLALLLAGDRNHHIENDIAPALLNHDFVITDRYIDSSLVFQRIDGVDLAFLWMINGRFLKPHLSISITASPETIASRLSTRQSLDRFETLSGRENEVRLFKEASTFLRDKGFNVRVFTNENISLQDAVNVLSNDISGLGQ